MTSFWEVMGVFLGGVITVAIIATIVSKNSNAPGLTQNFFSGAANLLGTAQAPVTGANVPLNLSYASTFGA